MAFKDDLILASTAGKATKAAEDLARQNAAIASRQALISDEVGRVQSEMLAAAALGQESVTLGFMGTIENDPVIQAVQLFLTSESITFTVELLDKNSQANIETTWKA